VAYGAGHLVPQDRPEEFAAAAEALLPLTAGQDAAARSGPAPRVRSRARRASGE
jgi:hypothetical protein